MKVDPHANCKEHYAQKNATQRLGMRVSPHMLQQMKVRAAALGMNVSDYLRKLVREDFAK